MSSRYGAAFEQCRPVLRKYFGTARPAAMMISAGLAGPRMEIGIEVTRAHAVGNVVQPDSAHR